MPSSRGKAALALVAGVLVLAALLAYVGPAKVLEAVRSADPLLLALGALTYGAFFVLRGVRWRVLFSHSAPDVRLSTTTGVTAIGWLANSVLPLKGGDVLRAALLAKRDKVHLATSAATVALERVLDLLGLAVVAAAGLLLIPAATELPPSLERALRVVWVLPLVALAMLFVLVRWRARTVEVAGRLMRPFGKLGAKLVRFGDTVLAGFDALSRRPKLLAKLVPLTLAVAIAQAGIFTFLVSAFIPGTPLALAFAGSAIFLLSFVVSVTPGNVGTYEAAFVAVFVALGVPAAIAVPASILTHLMTTLVVAAYGAVGLLALGIESDKLAWRPSRVPQGGMP